ncbi:rRNA maturation RNase YbeY [Marinilabilia salmonicolor]|uniref:Endoribonuclease YbeY n=1 Tax=Marinilabilia salmonicolor TaxID=989 RepID=A0A2T0XSJ0_9BACT|nr:rRNA maturation RNase YbeY [Marinilabilia salmonicolor]PRZ01910.1 rRNA maturation RNase YbeY [Marinilabilia salmonicolor]RCW32012.1 rRNA maturation RNase YbeY [Marinilabilia salmonicolor]
MSISFSTYDIEYQLPNTEKITDWITEVIENKGFKVGEINYLLCSDDYILESNKKFLSHNYLTDIITFDYSSKRKISGDVLISIPTVSVNAERFGVTFFNELLRVIIHGVLHLMGYDDHTDEEKQTMRNAENIALLFYETNFQ